MKYYNQERSFSILGTCRRFFLHTKGHRYLCYTCRLPQCLSDFPTPVRSSNPETPDHSFTRSKADELETPRYLLVDIMTLLPMILARSK